MYFGLIMNFKFYDRNVSTSGYIQYNNRLFYTDYLFLFSKFNTCSLTVNIGEMLFFDSERA